MRHLRILASVLAGLSGTAVAQAPSTAPASGACTTAQASVYFDNERSNLNQMALNVIDALVTRTRNSPNCTVAGVQVTGHADTYASVDDSLLRSQMRASVVRDALVARGIQPGSISMEGRGESELAVATRDGMHEPQNNRVIVTITFR